MTEPATQRLLTSFGRRKGRRLRTTKKGLVETLLPKLQVQPEGDVAPVALLPEAYEYWLEVGFGGGEHLAHQARLHPHVGIVGCEPYINGMAELLRLVDEGGLTNIRIYNDDMRLLIDRWPDACLSRIYMLYPDPWPKMRHHKRRLLSTETLDRYARILKPGGTLQLATDDEDYATWMLERALAHPHFTWQAKRVSDWLNPPQNWLSTKYEKKALAAKRVPTYLAFTRS